MLRISRRTAVVTAVVALLVGCNRDGDREESSEEQQESERSSRRDRASVSGGEDERRERRRERRERRERPRQSRREGLPAPPDVAEPPDDAERTESGLASKVLEPGTGSERPGPRDRVKVHYTGWTTDGEMFDSSVKRGRPAAFPLNKVIKGWTEGLQLMVKGEKRRLWIPEELAYKGRRGAPQGMLVFDVELIEILDE